MLPPLQLASRRILCGGELHTKDFEQGAMTNGGQHAPGIAGVNTSQFKTGDMLECWAKQVGLGNYGKGVTQPY